MNRLACVTNEDQIDAVFRAFYTDAKARVRDGQEVVVELREPSKTRPQEERYHAMIGDIARQVPIMGKRLSSESFKRLLVDAFKHETKDDPVLALEWRKLGEYTVLPALNHDGFVVLGEQTRRFTKKLATAFIEWLFAFGAEHGVHFFNQGQTQAIDPKTGEIHAT